jgi:protein-L-isoaspartate(D-aspartate) O-methyltransferase
MGQPGDVNGTGAAGGNKEARQDQRMKLFSRDNSKEWMRANSRPDLSAARTEMIEMQVRRRGITDSRVLAAMDAIPREEFVPQEFRGRAYDDTPLPIGEGQTISQPYIVAAMTDALGLSGAERVLEVGTGCGYQAALLSQLAKEVFTIECRSVLARTAEERLARLGFANVHVHYGDGTLGLPEFGPFSAILVAAAAPSVPAPLLAQLADGGRLIIPVGASENQELQLVERDGSEYRTHVREGCRFVPLIGYHGWKEPPQR